MAKATVSNPQAFAVLESQLESLDGLTGKSGWFGTSKYEDGTPVAYIAAVQELGVTINHPGGTPYSVGPNGATFVALSSPGASSLPKTQPHTIVIPPRPFMRPTVVRMTEKWMEIFGAGAKAALNGKTTAYKVMEAVVLNAQEEIRRSISQVFAPPLKPGTIRARLKARSDNKTVGLLTKPLEDSGKMYDDVQGIVDKE